MTTRLEQLEMHILKLVKNIIVADKLHFIETQVYNNTTPTQFVIFGASNHKFSDYLQQKVTYEVITGAIHISCHSFDETCLNTND